MAQNQPVSGIVEDAKRIAVLATPIRVELITTIQALGGAATVAELALQLGRPADGLYYHLRALVRGGLAEERTETGVRRYHLKTPPGERMRLRYKPGANSNAKAVACVASSMSRLARRDFVRALSRAGTTVEGPARELWVARLRGWVDRSELTEINRLLQRLAELLLHSRPTHSGKLIALHWILAPIDAKPKRRASATRSKTEKTEHLVRAKGAARRRSHPK